MKIAKICDNCDKAYETNQKKSRFCSLPCSYQKTNFEKGERKQKIYCENPRLCLHCLSPISFKMKGSARFCSHSCAARADQASRPKKPQNICAYCSKTFKSTNSISKYCSRPCGFKAKFSKKYDQFLNNTLSKSASNLTLKKCLIHKDGEICTQCGQPPIHNGKQLCLQLDHIDGNSDNNLPNNLRLLCPNCHSQTETFCGGNPASARNAYRQEWRKKQNL